MSDEKKPSVLKDIKVTGVSLIDPRNSVSKNPQMMVTVQCSDDKAMKRLKTTDAISIGGNGIAVPAPVPWWKKILKWIGIGLAAVGFIFVVGFRAFMGIKKGREDYE